MILTNNQIYNLYDVLLFLKQNNKSHISIATGYSILRNLQILEPIYNLIAESRTQILLTHGSLNNDNSITIPKEFIEQTNVELYKLGTIENEIELIKLNLSDLYTLSLSLDEIEKLYPIINGEA